MEPPYEKQYSQEGNPRAYMTMRDYRNLPYQWQNQQPLGRNPNPNRSMRDYRDQWMSAPVYSVPSTYPPPPQYDHPEPPFYASTPQSPQSPQPPQSIPVRPHPLALLRRGVITLIVRAHPLAHSDGGCHPSLTGYPPSSQGFLSPPWARTWDHELRYPFEIVPTTN